MDENKVQRKTVPLVHGRMIYCCESCGKSWPMYLEKGIEEFGENHKPSPFSITCPRCGGWAMDVSGILKVPGGDYIQLPDRASYFANLEGRDCGVPTFSDVESEKEVMDELRKTSNEQLERMINAAFTEEKAKAVEELAGILAKRTSISVEAAIGALLNILKCGCGLSETLEELNGLIDECPKPQPKKWKFPWKKRRTFEQQTASRFRQRKTGENAWIAKKRTGKRNREWRGPWREVQKTN